MGLLDIFGRAGPQKALKLKSKVTQKYGDPLTRQKALTQLGAMKFPEAVTTLMARFTITVEPLTTDEDEKQQTFDLIKGFGPDAVEPLKAFLKKSDQASSWTIKILGALIPETELVKVCLDVLTTLSGQYTRDPEKKLVLIHFLAGKDDPRIVPALLPLLEDISDEVKIAALNALGKSPDASAGERADAVREPILRLLTHPEAGRRVQTAAIGALCQAGLKVQSFREKVEALVSDPYFIDKSGLIKKRG